MDYQTAFAISAAGMQVEQARFNVSALNLANANSSAAAGGAYRPLRLISVAGAPGSFSQMFANAAYANNPAVPVGPRIAGVVEQDVAPHRVLDPGNPAADEKGFVEVPGVNTAGEMVNIMTALRAYDANVVAINAAKSMTLKALEIGGTS